MLEFPRNILSLRLVFEIELRCEDPSDERAAGLVEGLSADTRRHKRIVLIRLGGPGA